MNQPFSDLDWQAFRYVAGELSGEERTAFEAVLAYDPLACEAVVRAVELGESVLLAERDSVIPVAAISQPVAWSQSLPWLALGAAACLCLMWLTQSNSLRGSSSISPELAAVWGSQLEEGDEAVLPSSMEETASPELLQDEPDTDLVLIDEPAPGWMLEAVRGLKKADKDETDATEELES